jgi:hypothetical protein
MAPVTLTASRVGDKGVRRLSFTQKVDGPGAVRAHAIREWCRWDNAQEEPLFQGFFAPGHGRHASWACRPRVGRRSTT